ncbi:hypothetical protein [Leifsonia sp. Root112D2]|uniref:hypothetical protein n=1 Tax=Leifsonia sp. Root112D2 TaxID=1736426 RepID=UPI0012F9DF90|nr:hypothetical protein [Leifsonia sp. Root112D2]
MGSADCRHCPRIELLEAPTLGVARKAFKVQTQCNPKELHALAVRLWQQERDDDPERSDLYVAADTRAASGVSPVQRSQLRRAENWTTALHRYETFWRINSRTARENTRNRAKLPAEERRMGEWARYQRRFEERLCLYQRIRLDVSPAFAWDPQEDSWNTKLKACAAHLEISGRLPYLNAADQTEFQLARWLGFQLRQYKSGTLSAGRRDHVTALLQKAALTDEPPMS